MKGNLAKTNKRYIKSENRKWLIGYLLFNIVIFALFAGFISPTFSDANVLVSKLKDPQGFLPLIAISFSIVLEGFLSNSIKEFLIFWRIKHRLPGHRAFSIIGPRDARVNMQKVRTLFPHGLPTNPEVQNQEWFDLYKKYEDERRVFYSHKAFLLTRDLTALTAAALPLSFVGHLIAGSQWNMIGYHSLFLVGILILVSVSARNYGNRFVANVLIEAV
jgi:hypothetical protein